MKKLNLGCGEDLKKGWDNVDIRKLPGITNVFDLDKYPYPFKNNTYNEVLMKMILEHLKEPIKTLKEVIRISKPNAKLTIIVPHAFSYASKTDIQHKTNFTENSFTEELLKQYALTNLRLIGKSFIFKNNWKRFIPFKNYLKIFFNGVYEDICFEFIIKK
ncbi:MAG: class I SAM-dependent methyltransferase [Nanoarchaeota archaeon]|nr:class I SAM-dependent methyltransferase [Nanoarchaeota archaeon]MBU1028053.1 class I SAM-dependent methyltransferase [Nanoarchaeota archaeon]